jgi:acyl-CoA synthetase (AMP-forming)/AMP-acid ligase II
MQADLSALFPFFSFASFMKTVFGAVRARLQVSPVVIFLHTCAENMASQTEAAVHETLIGALESHLVANRGSHRAFTNVKLAADGVAEEASLTFSQLREQALAVGYALRTKWGASWQDRTLLIYPPGLEFVVSFIGCQYVAVVAVPYYPPVVPLTPLPGQAAKKLLADGISKLAAIADVATPSMVLSSRGYLSALQVAQITAPAETARWPELPTHSTDSIALDERPPQEWLAEQLASRSSAAAVDDIAFLQFTSGSTGLPSGVVVRVRNQVQCIRNSVACLSGSLHSSQLPVAVVSWVPLYHDLGLIGSCCTPVYKGWRSDLLAPTDFLRKPGAWLHAISRLAGEYEIATSAPDFGYSLVARKMSAADKSTLKLAHLKSMCNAAEPVRAATIASFNKAFEPCGFTPDAWACSYGLAENVVYACGRAEVPVFVVLPALSTSLGCIVPAAPTMHATAALELLRRPAAGGSAARGASDERGNPPINEGSDLVALAAIAMTEEVSGVTVRIVDPDSCCLLTDGTVGEIWLSGPSVCAGYWGADELTRERFSALITAGEHTILPQGTQTQAKPVTEPVVFLRTGDLGVVRDGRLLMVGRLKALIKIRGSPLHAYDVETSAQACADLRPGCCAAFSIERAGEEQLVIMAEVRDETWASKALSASQIVSAVCSAVNVAHAVTPSAVVLLRARSIPKTTSGKLQRHECRSAYLELAAAAGKAVDAVVPRISAERVLHMWAAAAAEISVEELEARLRQLRERLPASDAADDLLVSLLEVTARHSGFDAAASDVNWDEMGLDSAAWGALRADIEKLAGGRHLDADALIKYPTPRSLLAWLSSSETDGAGGGASSGTKAPSPPQPERVKKSGGPAGMPKSAKPTQSWVQDRVACCYCLCGAPKCVGGWAAITIPWALFFLFVLPQVQHHASVDVTTFAYVAYALALIFYVYTQSTDPGIVGRPESAATRGSTELSRATGRYVDGFDHYCEFLGADVGKRNLWSFKVLLVLLSHDHVGAHW